MQDQTVHSLFVQQRKKYIRLNEVMDTTMQLAEAVGRDDNVSAEILIAMRQEPLLAIEDAERAIANILSPLDDKRAAHLRRLLTGRGEEAPLPGEQELDQQSQQNHRLLARIVTMDQPLNRKITKEKSIYR